MTNELKDKLEELKSLINQNEDVLLLNKLDEQLANNEEVMKLSYKMDVLSVEYSDALKHFKEDSDEVKLAQQKLYQAKLELDSHALVKSYNEVYLRVKKLYKNINKEIFGDFSL